MTSMMSKIEEFVIRNGLSEKEKREMLEILNESLLEISRGIMNENKVKSNVKGNVKVKENKRYKSKKAEEYAEEHGLRLEDFDMNEISKKDVETKIREITKEGEIRKEDEVIKSNKLEVKREKVKREKVICSGINKRGEACKSVGTIQPEDAKKKYCFRHAEDFRSFECDSDSSNEEESIECESIEKDRKEEESNKKENSDNELEEEEYN